MDLFNVFLYHYDVLIMKKFQEDHFQIFLLVQKLKTFALLINFSRQG
jgi:hypothetical protein